MNGYGPYTPALRTIIPIPLTQDTERVYVANRSDYDLLVACADSPPDLGAIGLTGGWQTIIPARNVGLVPTSLATRTFYTLPIGTAITALASVGVTSLVQQVWITPLTSADRGFSLAPVYAAPDYSAQPRVIALPCAPLTFASGTLANSTGTTATVSTFILNGATGNPTATAFLYWLYMSFFPADTTAQGTNVALFVDLQTSGGVSKGFPFPHRLHHSFFNWGGNGSNYPIAFAPPVPISYVIPGNDPTYTNVVFYLDVVSTSKTIGNFLWNALTDVGESAPGYPPGIGNASPNSF